MNLTWHIVKKDLRRFWLPIALMVAILLSKAVLLNMAVHYAVPNSIVIRGGIVLEPMVLNSATAVGWIDNTFDITRNDSANGVEPILMSLFCVTDFLLLIILVLGVLYEDPTLGDKTFWRTQPIGGWQMLAAKLIFLFLLAWPLQAALQVEVNFSLLARVHYWQSLHPNLYPELNTPMHWYDSLGYMTLIQAVWVSAVMVVPLLWRSLIVGAGSLFFTYFVLVATISIVSSGRLYAELPTDDLVGTILSIFFGTVAAVAVWMYCGRRRAIGFMIFGTGLAAITLVLIVRIEDIFMQALMHNVGSH